MHAPRTGLVQLSDVRYSYAGAQGPVEVLHGVDLTLAPGEFASVRGASGGGKSTLMNLIGGLERPDTGRLTVNGHDLPNLDERGLEKFRQTQVSFVFQFFNLLGSLTALENVMLALEAMDEPQTDVEGRSRELLREVGLEAKLDRFPSELSGGEQQRVAIARALVKRAPLILADEPTGNLDEATAASVLDLFIRVQRQHQTALLLITHDPVIARRADRQMELHQGRLRPMSTSEAPAGESVGSKV